MPRCASCRSRVPRREPTNEVTGESLRPDFFFLDDIQTDEIAFSDVRVSRMSDLCDPWVCVLGGLSYTLSGVMTATCIAPHDVTEHFLEDQSCNCGCHTCSLGRRMRPCGWARMPISGGIGKDAPRVAQGLAAGDRLLS